MIYDVCNDIVKYLRCRSFCHRHIKKHRHSTVHGSQHRFFFLVQNTMFFQDKVDQESYNIDTYFDEKCAKIDYDMKNVVSTSIKKLFLVPNTMFFRYKVDQETYDIATDIDENDVQCHDITILMLA